MLLELSSWKPSGCQECQRVKELARALRRHQDLRRITLLVMLVCALVFWVGWHFLNSFPANLFASVAAVGFFVSMWLLGTQSRVAAIEQEEVELTEDVKGNLHLHHFGCYRVRMESGDNDLHPYHPWIVSFRLTQPESAVLTVREFGIGAVVTRGWKISVGHNLRSLTFTDKDWVPLQWHWDWDSPIADPHHKLDRLVKDVAKHSSVQDIRYYVHHFGRCLRQSTIRIGAIRQFIEESGASKRSPLLEEIHRLAVCAEQEVEMMVPSDQLAGRHEAQKVYLANKRRQLNLTYEARA